MRYFRKIGDIDVSPVLDRVIALRLEEDGEEDIVVPGLLHKAVPLRLHDDPTPASFFRDPPVFDRPLLAGWPEMRALLSRASEMVAVDPVIGPQVHADQMGRVVFSIIYPQSFIQWHRDTGDYIDATFRFHIPLITDEGAVNYEPGPEHLHMRVGELTWIANRELHSAVNWTDLFRNHLIFELRCRNH